MTQKEIKRQVELKKQLSVLQFPISGIKEIQTLLMDRTIFSLQKEEDEIKTINMLLLKKVEAYNKKLENILIG